MFSMGKTTGILACVAMGFVLDSLAHAEEPEVIIYREDLSYILSDADRDHESIKTTAHTLTKPTDTIEDKILKAYNFVTQKIAYIPEPKGVNILQKPSDTLRKGGDSEDISVLLVALLYHNSVKTYFIDGEDHAAVLAGPVTGAQNNTFFPEGALTAFITAYSGISDEHPEGQFVYLEATGGKDGYPGATPTNNNMRTALVIDIINHTYIAKIGTKPITIKRKDGSFMSYK